MHILAISGSLRSGSSNTRLLRAMAALAPEGVSVTLYEGIGDLPHFSPDRDCDPLPEAVVAWRKQVRAADGVIVCTPEYAHGMPGSLKNALDWTVSSGDFSQKPALALSAGPAGGSWAHASLVETLTMIDAHVVAAGSRQVAQSRQRFTEDGRVTDPETEEALRTSLWELVLTIRAGAQ